MVDKLKFVGWVIACMLVAYVLLLVFVPFVSEIAFETANETSVTAFPTAQGFLRWVPILLYTLPGVIGLGLIVWKLRKDDDEV